MADQFVERSREGWGSRLGNAFGGIVAGIVLTLISFPLLFWNEGRAVKRYQTLEEGSGVVISVSSDKVDPALEGKLVHMTGRAEVSGDLRDEEFGVSAEAIKLRREAEMYQWIESKQTETKNKVGGGTEKVTTTTYEKTWAPTLKKSSNFGQPAGHENPDSMPYESKNIVADRVSLGVFKLPGFFIEQIKGDADIPVTSLETLPEALRARAKLHNGGIYLGNDPAAPAVGDVRVDFSAVLPTEISVVAKQSGDTLEKYHTAAGGQLEILAMGSESAESMFEAEQVANKSLTWILRGVGFVLMAIGLGLVARPLKVMADVLPIAGRVVGAGVGFFAFALAAIGSSITIAAAWIFYRPLIGISVLVITGLFLFWLIKRLRKAKPEEPEISVPAESPPPL